jgi:hypothetical protein
MKGNRSVDRIAASAGPRGNLMVPARGKGGTLKENIEDVEGN